MATQTNPDGFTYDPVTGTPVDKATADNAAARKRETDALSGKAVGDAAQALQTANSYAGQIAQANTTAGEAKGIAQSAVADVDEIKGPIDTRLTAVEVAAGYAPGDATDAAMTNIATQENTEFRAALNAQYVDKSEDEAVDGAKTFTSQKGLRSSTWLGLGAGAGSARMPFYQNSIVDGTLIPNEVGSAGGDDYVGHQINVTFQGGFENLKTILSGGMTAESYDLILSSGTFTDPVKVGYTVWVEGAGLNGADLKATIVNIISGTRATLSARARTTVTGRQVIATLAADHNFLFGANDFFTTGKNAGDLDGIDNIFGRLQEVHIYTPNATLDTVKATSSEAAIEETATGTTVKTFIGHHVKALVNRAGAAVEDAYSFVIEGDKMPGSARSWALFVKTGLSRMANLRVVAESNTENALQVRAALEAGGQPPIALYDYVGVNRRFRVGSDGAVISSADLTAREGSGSVRMGQVNGGFAGIQFAGTGPEIASTRSDMLAVRNAKAFSLPSVTTATRIGAASAGYGAVCIDSTLGRPIWSDGTAWRDFAGVAV